jgi:predicted ATP-dependent protease
LGFATTADVEPRDAAIGQRAAHDAIAFGLGVPTPGYNLFATGPVGSGKRAALEAELGAHARACPDGADIVYVHNFTDVRSPLAISLPAGDGPSLARAMSRFVEEARRALVRAFESETHQSRLREVAADLERERDGALAKLKDSALKRGIALELTPAGVGTIPLVDGQPVTRDDFVQLPPAAHERYQEALRDIEPEVHEFLAALRAVEEKTRERMRELNQEAGLFAVGHLVEDLKQKFSNQPRLAGWLDAVRDDMIDHLEEFASGGEAEGGLPAPLRQVLSSDEQPFFARYQVNVFVTNEPGRGAPVVSETSPTYLSLFGGIEHRGVFGGGLVTDHRYLRAGAIHRANGGYLMLPARALLVQPLLWERLKDVLQVGRVRLENLGDQYALLPTPTLQPEPIALSVKVALYGASPLYELAWRLDEDVRKLFRVKVDFEPRIQWTTEGESDYAAFLSAESARAGLLPFDAQAVAGIVEEGARISGHRDWLSTRVLEIAGLAAEASHAAQSAHAQVVSDIHVTQALRDRRHRSNAIERRLLNAVSDGTLLVEVSGSRAGQLNGLAVVDVGDYAFGHPVRISATSGPGKGDVVSIEREVKLSGPIHNKGFLTLGGFLENRYGSAKRLALSALIAFEQSYEEIEGDSASVAELLALLSDLAEVPLRQYVAVTGSVNQHGEIQAIGGVNQKVEGFFRTCRELGLNGEQGVLIPASNVQHLMLDPEVVEAVARAEFHVWSAATIDEAVTVVSGMDPTDFHSRVRDRFHRFAAVAEPDRSRNHLRARSSVRSS